MAYESQAVKLIKSEVLPRLEGVEGEVKLVKTDLKQVKGILIDAGLDNGNGEGAATLHRIVSEGIKVNHRRSVGSLFLKTYFGWFGRLASHLPKRLMIVVGYVSAAAWAYLGLAGVWQHLHPH